MTSLFRLQTPGRRTVERDRFDFTLDDGGSIEILRVRDPRARRMRLSVDERGARLTLPPRASLVSGERFVREPQHWLQPPLAAHDENDAIAPPPRAIHSQLPRERKRGL